MIIPDFHSSPCRKACAWLDKKLDWWFVRYGLGPLFFAIPTSLLLTILSKDQLRKELIKFIGAEVSNTLTQHYIWIIVAVVVIAYLLKFLREFVRALGTADASITRNQLVYLINAVNIVVSGKTKRFLEDTKRALKEGWDAQTTFSCITKPEQQIAILINAMHSYFEILFKNRVSFRIGLMVIKDGKPIDWFTFWPQNQPPRTPIETLTAPSSTIMRAINKGGLIIVSDVLAELKKPKTVRNFVKGNTQSDEEGSIFAYPIYCPNIRKPIYVLSILANKNKVFTQENRQLWEWIVRNFIDRIILEHHLLLMKEATSGKEQ